jgi:hypothetical protein
MWGVGQKMDKIDKILSTVGAKVGVLVGSQHASGHMVECE